MSEKENYYDSLYQAEKQNRQEKEFDDVKSAVIVDEYEIIGEEGQGIRESDVDAGAGGIDLSNVDSITFNTNPTIPSPSDGELWYDNEYNKLAFQTDDDKIILGQYNDFFNGSAIDKFTAIVSSNGTTITLTVDANPTGDIRIRFKAGIVTLSSGSTIALTAGTSTVPQINYIWVDTSGVLQKSTTSYPDPGTTQHLQIGRFLVFDAVTAQTYPAMINHNVNNEIMHPTSFMGHMWEGYDKLRELGALYISGLSGNAGGGEYLDVSGGTTVRWKSTSAVIKQLHNQSFPAVDTSGSDVIFVRNKSTGWDKGANLYTLIDELSDATAFINNRYYNLVFVAVANSQNTSYIYCNLPNASYTLESSAQLDNADTADYTIPDEFKTTSILICRITIQYKTTGWTISQTESLLGKSATGGTVGFTRYTDAEAIAALEGNANTFTQTNTFNGAVIAGNTIRPDGKGTRDLGATAYTFNDIYLHEDSQITFRRSADNSVETQIGSGSDVLTLSATRGVGYIRFNSAADNRMNQGLYFDKSGADIDITFKDSGGAQRSWIVFANSNDGVYYRNRAANGFHRFYANTATGGSGGEVQVMDIEDDMVTIHTDLDVDGGTLHIGGRSFSDDGSRMQVSSTFQPSVDNALDLGTSAKRWDDVWATNGTIQTSSLRNKTNITDLETPLHKILALRGVTFNWIDNLSKNRDRNSGFILEEVEPIIPEAIHYTMVDGKRVAAGMKYNAIIPYLVGAIHDLKTENDELKARLDRIEKHLGFP